jgi:hypothetical protein
MDGATSDHRDGFSGTVDRRGWLRLATGVGLTTALAACGARGPSAPAHSVSTNAPSQPTDLSVAAAPMPPGTGPATTTATIAASAALLCRDAWGARPAHPGGARQTISRMTLHHTAVVLGDNRNAPGRLRQHQRYHQDSHGWIDIAYHVGIDRNGNIYQLRTPELVGDTATEYNPTGHFLVLCEGDFDREHVSEAQLDSAALTFAWAAQNFHIASDTLAGHRDFAATACPGANLYAHLTSGDLRGRVDRLLTAGQVNLQEVCGSEAAEKVAQIEAGN